MDIIVDRFNKIKGNIGNSPTNIIAVSKKFSLDHIKPLIDHGHIHFGENKVQEADSKWSLIKREKSEIILHMIGKLQSNKAKKAIQIFDYIHSLDSQKLAESLAKYEIQLKKKIKYFIQVNVGLENQKSGIKPDQLDDFYSFCVNEKKLNIVGLMAIPPNDKNTNNHFKYLFEAGASLGLKELSMGMSSDYKLALEHKSTFVRIGSAIFGERI